MCDRLNQLGCYLGRVIDSTSKVFFLIWFIEHAPLLVVVLHAFSRAMYIDFTRSNRQSLLIQ